MHRSLLFVPGDSDRKIEKSQSVPADMIIFDLEDAVAAAARPEARLRIRDYLQRRSDRSAALYVRINPLNTDDARKDLGAVMAGAPDGIVLPKAQAPDDIRTLETLLTEAETQCGLKKNATRILPVTTEIPAALFTLGEYRHVADRLSGLTWGAEDLGASIGAMGKNGDASEWSDPFALARSLCLFAAAAAGVQAIDTLYANFKDGDGLAASAARARRDGFTGKLAIHPAQVETINNAFTPSTEEIDEARAIIALFAANPGAGALAHKGAMVDMPHLVQARKIIALSEKAR